MKLKLDENLPPEARHILREAGHDTLTIDDQGMAGTDDNNVAKVCQDEGRVLETLDMGFANIRSYPPEEYHGIVILRPNRQSKPQVLSFVERLVKSLENIPVDRNLWIVGYDKIRLRSGNGSGDE